MGFSFSCQHCGQELEAEDEWIGMKLDCSGCGIVILVPDPKEPQKHLSREEVFLVETQDMIKLPEKESHPPVNPEPGDTNELDGRDIADVSEMSAEDSMADTVDESLEELQPEISVKKGTKSKTLAVLGMVFGILSLIPYADLVFCPLGFVFSLIAITKISKRKAEGNPFAVIGLITSFIGLILMPIFFT